MTIQLAVHVFTELLHVLAQMLILEIHVLAQSLILEIHVLAQIFVLEIHIFAQLLHILAQLSDAVFQSFQSFVQPGFHAGQALDNFAVG